MRDCGAESDFAGEIAGSSGKFEGSRAEDGAAFWRSIRAGDESGIAGRVIGEAGDRRTDDRSASLGSRNEEGIDAAAISGLVLLHAAEPRRGRHDGEALPAEQDCRRAVLELGAGSNFGRNGVRAGEEGLAGADDSEYRGAFGEGRAAARCFYAAHGEIRFADERQGRHEPFRRFGEAAYRFADFDAGRFDSSDDWGGHGGAVSGTENCDDDMDRRWRKFDWRVSRRVEFRGHPEGAVCFDSGK